MKENKAKEKRTKTNKGITLIALVITIIVLLILAGVSIAMLTGDNGILTQAQNAKNRTEEAQADEESKLESYEQYIKGSTNGGTLITVTGNETTNTTVYDSLGNKIVVPAGFKVINPGDNVEDGIIIEDVSYGATAGSQFVWIPVGDNIKKKDGTTFDIKLSRYMFDDKNGIATDKGNENIAGAQELNTGTVNITAKEDIESEEAGFRKSAIENGGYYIGRYEARTSTSRTSKEDPLTQLTIKPSDYVYRYVKQPQAANLSRNMYADNINFTSDLTNSYAWDTAIVFLQECDDREGENNKIYSLQNSLNTGSVADKGTNETDMKDLICNIYDMASNCFEWSTETYKYNNTDWVNRGGYYHTNYHAASRNHYLDNESASYIDASFRVLLYIK